MLHFFAVLFWAAGVLALVAVAPQLGIAIFVVVLNGIFAFVQEEQAEHSAEKLRQMLPNRATVGRDGISVQISAEGTVLSVAGLAVDTSAMTGECPRAPGAGRPGLRRMFRRRG
jgi:magnesium-transporting ATPase (P-type)